MFYFSCVGFVGQPLPGIQIQLSEAGEIQVKGEGIFTHYWKRPQATEKAFTNDGWFITGNEKNSFFVKFSKKHLH